MTQIANIPASPKRSFPKQFIVAATVLIFGVMIRLAMSANPDFLGQVWYEEGEIYFFSSKYRDFLSALTSHDFNYINLIPNLVSIALVGGRGGEISLLYFPYLFKIINWIVFSFCCTLLVSERFVYILPRLRDRALLALLFCAYPHVDFNLPYNSTYGAVFVFLWLGSSVDRKNDPVWLFWLECCVAMLFAFAKPVIVYAAIPYIFLCLLFAAKVKCFRSVVIFVWAIISLIIAKISLLPLVATNPFSLNLILDASTRVLETIFISLSGYFSLPVLDGLISKDALYVVPMLELVLYTSFIYYRKTSILNRLRSLGSGKYLSVEKCSLLYLLLLLFGSNVAYYIAFPGRVTNSLISGDSFVVFNRHLFLPFVAVTLTSFITINKICLSFSRNIKLTWLLNFFAPAFIIIQLISVPLFYRSVFSIPQVALLRNASELSSPALWQLTVSDLMGAYPCAPLAKVGHSVNCTYESRDGEIFNQTVRGASVIIHPRELNEKNIRGVLVVLNEALGSCSSLYLEDRFKHSRFVGKRDSEVSKYVYFSINPPVDKQQSELEMNISCSAGVASGKYYILQM